jgi:3-oxoacyl-[acyl-carrier-protein] synthase-1
MRPLFITASTIVTAIGRGGAETLDALHARRGGLRPCDFADVTGGHIGRVGGLEAHVLPVELAHFDCRNNRLADLALRTDGFADRVWTARELYGPTRIAVVVGTSTSGIHASEEAYRARDPRTGALPAAFNYAHTHDLFSLARFVRDALGLRGPTMTVSTACASSARSFVDAYHLIASGVCDAAVVGGADSLCRMTLHGFAALDLISPVPCRPCDVERAGISIGEAAGFMLLEREGDGPALLGYGASSDGHHMSAPHPEAAGAIDAMRQALERAGLAPRDIDYVNLHGTGTRANDAMEDLAVAEVFGTDTPCSSVKAWTGHALGAAGIVEAGIAALCIRHGFMPGCLNVGAVDPSFRARVLVGNEDHPVRRVISNSFGFGGANCSLILGTA